MKHLKTFFSVLALIAAFSCTKTQTANGGQVSFNVLSDSDIVEVTKSQVSDYTNLPSAGDFTIKVTDASGASIYSGKISGWDASTQLSTGNYSVTAEYGALDEEGFDKPYFYGSANFAIVGGNTTAVSIPVSLGNTIVKVSCSDLFKKYYSNYSFTFSRGTATLASFAKDDARAAFIDGYRVTLSGTLSNGSKTQSFSKDYTNLKEATAYTFHFDISNVGTNAITITFNDIVDTIELGDVELND